MGANKVRNKLTLNIIPKELLSEAIESLDFALIFYDKHNMTDESKYYKQAVINLYRFCELTLKYMVAKINPILLFADCFEKTPINRNSKTISFSQALNFYINIVENKITKGVFENKTKLVKTAKHLKDYRNTCQHFVLLLSQDKYIHKIFIETVEVMYYLYLEEDISKAVDATLSVDAKQTLQDLFDTQKANLELAYKKVGVYLNNYEAAKNGVHLEAYKCPICNHKTLISSSIQKDYFNCIYCSHKEEGKQCTLHIKCDSQLIPESYLLIDDNGYIACEDCIDKVKN